MSSHLEIATSQEANEGLKPLTATFKSQAIDFSREDDNENNDHHHLFNHHRHHHQQVRAVMGPNCQSKIHLELLGKGLATMKMFTIIIIINIIIIIFFS